MSNFPPITAAWFGAFERLHGRVFGWASANPNVFLGAGAAALAAPLFMKNDERGYVKTAAITTPLIISAAMAAPQLLPKAAEEGRRLVDVVKKVPTDYGFRSGAGNAVAGALSFEQARAARRAGRISQKEFMQYAGDFFSGLPMKQITKDKIAEEYEALTKNFLRLANDPTKTRYLENAIFHARLKGAGAADKLNWKGLKNIAPSMTLNEMIDTIDANQGNIDWIRDMNFRMHQATKATGAAESALSVGELSSNKPVFPKSYRLDKGGMAKLQASHPHLVKELKAAGVDAKSVRVHALPGPNEAYNQIVGLRVGKLRIPVVQADGSVRLGRNFQNTGVSRFFMTHSEDVAADVYAIRSLGEGEDFVRGELNRAQFVVNRDPLNGNPLFVQSGHNMRHSGTGRFVSGDAASEAIAQATPNQIKFYSKQGVFADAPNSFPEMGNDEGRWSLMRPDRQVEMVVHQVENRGKTRSTGGGKIETLELAETRFMDPMGFNNREKESLAIKAANKPVWMSVSPGAADKERPLTTLYKGFSRTDYMDMPEFAVRSLQITPSQRALFGDLPEWKQIAEVVNEDMTRRARLAGGFSRNSQALKDAAMAKSLDLALSKNGFKQKALGYIMADTGVNELAAHDMWTQLMPFLSNKRNYESMREIGYIGEGSRIMSQGVGAKLKRIVNYEVHENSLPKRLLKGGFFGRDQTLGFNRGAAMFAEGYDNRVINHSVDPKTGMLLLQVEERFETQGLKTHNLGKQTVSRALDESVMDRIRKGFNLYFQASGQGGGVAKQVNSVVLEQFNSAKANNPLKIMNDVVADTMRRLGDDRSGADVSFLQPHLEKLNKLGYAWENDQLVTKTALLNPNIDLAQHEASDAMNVMRRMMDEVGQRIKAKQLNGDSFMHSYIDWSMKNPNRPYLDYVIQRGLPETMAGSDHMFLNHAQRVGITRDALQQMSLGGDHEIAREIMSRLKDDGVTGMALDFLKHTDPSNLDLSKPFGENVLSVEDAIGNDLIGQLSTAQNRTMTVKGEIRPNIFDPGHELAQKNYSIKIGDKYVPVPGREAYGGKANAHDLMSYSPNKWENELRDVLMIGSGRTFNPPEPGDFDKALDTYLSKVRESTGVGKESIWRAPNVDPLGFEGRASSRASTHESIFEIGVGKEYLAEMNAAQREALLKGDRLAAITVRHPINSVVKTYVKYDDKLDNTWMIGADPIVSRMMRMDADGDRVSFHLTNASIKDAIEDPNSVQNQMADFRRVFEGDELDPRRFRAKNLTTLFATEGNKEVGMISKFLNKARVKAIKARTGGASVGMLSNTFDLIETSLQHNELFKDPVETLRFHEFAYDVIREAPIAAQKLKGGEAYDDLTTLIGWNNKIRGALERSDDAAPGAFADALEEGARKFGKEIAINDAHRKYFNLSDEDVARMGRKINPYAEYAVRNRETLMNVKRGHDPNVTRLHEIMVASKENAANYVSKDIVSLFNNHVPISRAVASRGATMSAEALGAKNLTDTVAEGVARKSARAAEGVVNQAARSAEEVVRSARGSGAMKVLGVGAGIAAGAGLLFGSLHSPREGQALTTSGNKFRPEEKIGVGDHIPGEPETGSMSSDPPRRVRAAQQGVRTAVVAPMGRTTELEVNMKSPDRQSAAEAARMSARMAGGSGNQHVNITYRDTTRLDSLQTRERIREAMDDR